MSDQDGERPNLTRKGAVFGEPWFHDVGEALSKQLFQPNVAGPERLLYD
jgi:hypothetical protein